MEQFTYYTRCKFPQNFKVVSICAVDKTLVRMFSGKKIYEKTSCRLQQPCAVIIYPLKVAVATKNYKEIIFWSGETELMSFINYVLCITLAMLLQFFVFPSDHNYVYVHTEQLFSISIIIYMYQSCSFRNAARVKYRTHDLCDACESHASCLVRK